MAPEGLRPHSAIGAASGVTAPIEGGPSGDFCNWSSDTPAAPPSATTAPGFFPGAFFVPGSSAGHAGPGRGGSRLRQGAERRAGSAIGATEEASPGCRFPGKGEPPAPSASERFSPQRRAAKGVRVSLNSDILFRAGGL